MPGALLAHANLERAKMTGENRPPGGFLGCRHARLPSGATNLQHVNMSGAILENADLSGADLTGANLRGAVLTGRAFSMRAATAPT